MTSPLNPADATDNTTLEGTQWTLNSIVDSTGASVGALPNVTATMEFKGGRVTGKGSCNNYFGPFTQIGDQLTFSNVASTRMACPPDVMTQETAFLDALGNTTSFAITDDQLNLRDTDGRVVAILDRATPVPLTGRDWRLTAVNNGRGGVVSAVEGVEVTARFGADGRVEGTGGCNGFGTAYTVDGEAITFEPFVTTLKACADDAATQQESWFFAALGNAARYSIRNGRLELRDENGALQASFATG